MKTNLFYSLLIFLFFSCKPHVAPPEKTKKIVVHTFTGKGENNETINWFFIKNVTDRGFSGYYLESASTVNDFKQAPFTYSKTRPFKFESQYASGEKIQLIEPNDLPENILKDLPLLESLYE